MNRFYCSVSSAHSEEPLAGTAPGGVTTWLAVEIEGPWAPKPLDSPGVSAPLARALAQWESQPGNRIQLLKTRPTQAQRVWLADASGVYHWPLGTPDQLLAQLAAGVPTQATRVTQPVIWVCTHGKRDVCCARWGMPMYRDLVQDGRVLTLQTSHLGGHRFAATALVLPSRVLYGRLTQHDAPTLAQHALDGRIWIDKARGRTELSPRAQAAELTARLGDDRDLTVSVQETPQAVAVRLGDTVRHVATERIAGPMMQTSCDASGPSPTASWRCTLLPTSPPQ